jgi:hypothetical protein
MVRTGDGKRQRDREGEMMSIEVDKYGSIAITGAESIAFYRLMTLKRGIEMEAKGMRLTRGRTCLSIVKKEFGWKGNRDKILALLDEEIALRGPDAVNS